MTKIENLNGYANQFLISEDNKITFQSYESEICYLENDKLYLKDSMWDYPVTTRRYFKAFINQYTSFTYENKAQFLKEIKQNDKIEVL